MSVEGTWNTTVKSPMGDQKGTLTVNCGDGNSWTGNMAGGMGSMDITRTAPSTATRCTGLWT